MKINDAYTAMFQKYPDAVSIKQATKMLQLILTISKSTQATEATK